MISPAQLFTVLVVLSRRGNDGRSFTYIGRGLVDDGWGLRVERQLCANRASCDVTIRHFFKQFVEALLTAKFCKQKMDGWFLLMFGVFIDQQGSRCQHKKINNSEISLILFVQF